MVRCARRNTVSLLTHHPGIRDGPASGVRELEDCHVIENVDDFRALDPFFRVIE